MPHSDVLAAHGNGHIHRRHGTSSELPAPSAPATSASHHYDITPEVFRCFMSYESAPPLNHLSQPVHYHDPSKTSTISAWQHLPASRPTQELSLAQGNLQRAIRGMPKKKAALGAQIADKDKSLSASHALAPSLSIEPPKSQTPWRSPSSESLTYDFQQLQVSAQEQRPASTTPAAPETRQQSVQSVDQHHTSASHQHFRFPSLPTNLIDGGYHYRQRAAQFILLYSQQASREQLSRCNRLSLPLMIRDSHTYSRSGGNSRRTITGHAADQHGLDHLHQPTPDDDDDSVLSHHHAHNASDDDSEDLDFDACRTAHLGNKKKRKSSRFSSPGLASLTNAQQTMQTSAVNLTPNNAIPHRATDSVIRNTQSSQMRALVDKSNTPNQTPSQPSVLAAQKQNDVALTPPKPTSAHRLAPLRLALRQTNGERQRLSARKRIRARLAPILDRRRHDRLQEQALHKQESHAKHDAILSQDKAEADVQDVAATEKRVPSKRTSKAGKRAQAIRGGASSGKPLTIAEIRARAVAASGGLSNTPITQAKSSSSARSPKSTSSSSNGHMGSDSAKQSATSPISKLDSSPSPKSSFSATDRETARAPSTATDYLPTDSKPRLQSRLPAPTSTFDFRMSSAVTLRLRELRSQLDAATRHLSDMAKRGTLRLANKADGQAAPQVNHDDPIPSAVMNPNDRHADHLPPWVRGALDFQPAVDDFQVINSKPHTSRQTAKHEATSPSAPPIWPHRGSSTPANNGQSRSSPTSSRQTPVSTSLSTNKTSNSRRTAARNPASHKHGAACKHGHAHAHGHGRPHGSGSALFTDDDWICVFCEYELYYGEAPLMLRACRNRKKLVERKSKVKSKAQAALHKKSSAKLNGSSCQHGHDHVHDYGHRHHDHDYDHDCMLDHDHACYHDHGSVSGSEDCCHHDHDHIHEHDRHALDRDVHGSHRARSLSRSSHPTGRNDVHRERCDCGNSIHSSDFGDEDR
ncbi:uncharacterized protein UMAG_01021 [Mycosarcoma maydis]|uniref:Uncharacterized protein n=1 Tax=Mycosarcoma maydis TaxID=5270 RepID=A0A0D1E566_MYCMD|nr:uncharacterized protein UMAG_01021 [Ustilago maydis 521]KIS71109.1 hypothetical protein UMAG_01021 [Ustilago maydis 521]|eukprot:XP_011386998.1 hypothetical protein UMAG_01021 [Ustilago maydis 521]